MKKEELSTYALKTWCPGCGNYSLEKIIKDALRELKEEGLGLEKIVIITGIGCHGKISDYLNLNSFYSLHGRTIPVAEGMKLANPELIPIVCAGDGDVYGEGISHLIFAAKRNTDINVIIYDNRVYALTTGQFTPTSPEHFKGRSTPKGSVEKPFNPIELMLATRASFVARGYVGRADHLKNLIKQAVKHQGFSFIDVLQPCIAYFNTYQTYNEKVYELEKEKHDFTDYQSALERAQEWRYEDGRKIPIGLFYKTEKATFEQEILK